MQTSTVIPNIIPQQTTTASVELKDGQMIYGKVLKIHGNQTAEISIGQNKITAKLDAPIVAGEKYWFQVQTSGEMTALKVLPNNGTNQTVKEMSIQLLQHFSLPQTKEALSFAQFLVKNQIPFTKDQFVQALQWLHSTGNQTKNMPLLKLMHDFSMPFSESVFRSLASFDNGVSLIKNFSSLNSLLSVPKNETEAVVKVLLTQFLSTNAEKLADQGLQKLVTNWLHSEGNTKGNASGILQSIGFLSKNDHKNGIFQQAVKLLNNDATLVQNSALKQVIQLLNQMQTKQLEVSAIQQLNRIINEQAHANTNIADNNLWLKLQRILQQNAALIKAVSNHTDSGSKGTDMVNSVMQSVTLSEGVNRFANVHTLQTAMDNMSKSVLAYVSQVTNEKTVQSFRFMEMLYQASPQNGSYEAVRQALTNILLSEAEGKPNPALSTEEQQFVKQLLHAEINALSSPKSNLIANEIKQLLRQFGLGFEHYLANVDKGTAIKDTELVTLKPQLLQLMAETQIPAVREQAEQLLLKITAQQLLSQSSGPIQHFIAQFPLSLQRYHSEVTMQWSGRRNENGEIDPAFCRVLFYLQLENLKETVVDMIVQNRVMKISISNENFKEMKADAMPLLEQVKTNLAVIGYQVSSISFNPFYNKNIKTNSDSKSTFYKKTPYNGVDIKI